MSMTSDADVEQGISVTMEGGRVVIRPSGHLDPEAVDALLALVAGARSAGAPVHVDLEQLDSSDRAAARLALEGCGAAG